MVNQHWKNVERRVAKEIGGVRNPVSGRQRGEKGDVESDKFNIEVKAWDKTLPKYLMDMLDQARQAVEQSGKDQIPLVRYHTKHKRGDDDIVLIEWKHFKRLIEDFGTWV